MTHWIRSVERKVQNPCVLPVRASTCPLKPPGERQRQREKKIGWSHNGISQNAAKMHSHTHSRVKNSAYERQ